MSAFHAGSIPAADTKRSRFSWVSRQHEEAKTKRARYGSMKLNTGYGG